MVGLASLFISLAMWLAQTPGLVAVVIVGPDLQQAARSSTDQFARQAALVPPDIDGFLHIEWPADLRGSLAGTPLGAAFMRGVERTAFHKAWIELAESVEESPEALFDTLFGTRVSLAFRNTDNGPVAWCVLTTLEDEVWVEFISRMRPKTFASRTGIPVHRVPEHNLLLAKKGDVALIGPDPREAPSLFFDVLKTVASPERETLAGTEPIAVGSELEPGHINLMLRHAEPLGGWSVARIDAGADVWTVRHTGRYAEPPIARAPEPIEFDRQLFDALRDDHMFVVAEPLRFPRGSLATFVQSQLPAGAITKALLEGLGERLFIVGGETESDHLAVGFALEVHPKEQFSADFDRLVIATVNRMRDTLESSEPRTHPRKFAALPDHAVRHLEIGDVVEGILPVFPDGRDVVLTWMLTQHDERAWLIIASHPGYARTIQRAFDDVCADDIDQHNAARASRIVPAQVGFADARECSPHVRDVLNEVIARAAEAGADVSVAEPMLRLLADLFASASRLEWSIETPDDHSVTSTWTIHWR